MYNLAALDTTALILSDDAEIVQRIRAGDTNIAERLVAKYQRALVGFLLGRAAMPREDAEDMAQNIWLRAIPDLSRPVADGGYDAQRGSFYTFLIHRYAKFSVMQFIEAKRRKPQYSFSADDDDLSAADLPSGDDDPEQYMLLREELEERHAALCQCFRMTFLYGGYPHQVLAFGYSKLIYGQLTQREREPVRKDVRRRREVEGDPKRLDAEHGSDTLDFVEQEFWNAFKRISNLNETTLQAIDLAMQPTRDRLKLTVAEMSRGNKAFLEHHSHLAEQRVGQTTVRDYYGARGLNAITDWCDKVQNRVRERLGLARK